MNQYYDVHVPGVRAPVLLHHLQGAMDAGSAGRLVTEQLRAALPVTRIATFQSDEFVDYRANRPAVWLENWQLGNVEGPEIALDLIHDDAGVPILLLHGPEPDFKWQAFRHAVEEIIAAAGVEMTVSVHGAPMPVAHSRPLPVHLHGNDADATAGQPLMIGAMRLSASMDSMLEIDQAQRGGTALGLVAAVPFYLAESDFAPAAVALIRKLTEVTGLKLPIGDLEAAARHTAGQIDAVVAGQSPLAEVISSLEEQHDSLRPELISGPGEGELPDAEELAGQLAEFLRMVDSADAIDERAHRDAVLEVDPGQQPKRRGRYRKDVDPT
ncbi:PAC2 family protein [Buchananella hordeovulneris]|uniref:Uncharacterized protein n=1 Tax=Buchananella hordeovulneris TaxID=52770 RepID=A0A1Q5PVV0_9ACTO|nr:PAC2 family protein [Buchananella hordeovulneris]MDO5080576.1 PAC2 family protein [Buchananella hordeovulneris]OKL51540.1 hypothetical protein BSZ40_06760 [Buchananella hordeovulneris]RRD44071.1 PAC2 family protein [Buchananella hordeovulneris]RRD53632.1 PAC2 family protein [Buchananella hordeovulneris]